MISRKNSPLGLRPLAGKWDRVLVIILTSAAQLFTSLILNGGVDTYDEGLHYLAYPLFKAGKIPYVDFYPLFPPIWTYANIVIEKIFGEYLLVQRLWFVLQATLVVWACYALCLKVYSRRLPALGILVPVILFGFHPYWMPRWSGARLAIYIAMLMFYMRHVNGPERTANVRLFTLGLFTGLTNLYAFDVGIHITSVGAAIMLVTFLGTRRKGIREAALKFNTALAGFLLPLILWAAYLAYHDSLYGYFSTYYYVYLFQLMPISARILSGGYINFSNLRFILLFIFLIFLTAGILYGCIYKGFIKKELSGQWRVLIMAMLLSFAVSVSTLRALTAGPQYQMFALIPMLLWGGFAVVKLSPYLPILISKADRQGSIMSHTGVFEIIMIMVFSLLSYSVTIEETAMKIFATRTNIVNTRLLYQRDGLPKSYSSTVSDLTYIADDHIGYLANYIRSHTRPDEAVLAFPMYTEVIPALARRHNATSYPIPILIMGSPRRQLEYIAEIEDEKPRYAVLSPFAKFGGKGNIAQYFSPVYIYLLDNYRPVKDFPQGRDQQIWVRIDGDKTISLTKKKGFRGAHNKG